MKRRLPWFLLGGFVLIAAALVYAQVNGLGFNSLAQNPNGQALVETFGLIEHQYLYKLDPKQLDQVLQGGIKGMVQALDDPFTSYSSPHSTQVNNQDLQGQFYGIGVEISAAPGGGALINAIYPGLPAYQAGLRVGDTIVEVDGKSVTKLGLNSIVSLIRGPKGTQVEIGVVRPGVQGILHFTVTREKVPIISVSKTMLPGHIGYIAINTFDNMKVIDQLNAALEGLKAEGMQKLILDLRDNGGGLLQQGCEVASDFLNQGPIVWLRFRNGQTELACAASGHPLWSGPMVVLVNGGTASASEIVTSALQDYKRALVIGTQTFGKGVGQDVIPLPNGGELTLVSFEWLTPKKQSINKVGVTPNIVVKGNRFPTPLTFQGSGAQPDATVTLTVNGQTFTTKADAQGNFSFTQPEPAPPVSPTPGVAVVNPNHDAILAKALQVLGQ